MMTASEPKSRRPSAGAALVGVAACALIAAGIDLLTPTSFEPGILYLPAVILMAWHFGIAAALLLAFAAVLVRFPGHPRFAEFSICWSACSWFGVYFLAALLTVLLRRSIRRERMQGRTDRLTGLANRTAMRERIEAELNRGRRAGMPLTVAYFDCDDFKQVNDRQGHAVGDRVLQATAVAMRRGVRNYDLVARPGGDEFIVVLPNTTGVEARTVIERIRQQLADVMRENGWNVSCSVGAAIFIEIPKSADEAIDAADRLMYAVKRSGKNDVRLETFGSESLVDSR